MSTWGEFLKDLGVDGEGDSEEAIQGLESSLGVRFCDDHRLFLRHVGGIDFRGWLEGQAPEASNAIFDAVGERLWIFETYALFDVQGLTEASRRSWPVPPAFWSVFGVLGRTSTGDRLVQVLRGPRRGRVAMFDHDYSDLLEDMLRGESEEYELPFDDFESASAADILACCVDEGALTFFEDEGITGLESLVRAQFAAYSSALNPQREADGVEG